MAQKQVNLKIVSDFCYYNQNPQTSEIQWSLLNRIPEEKNSFKELHLQVKCREYFGDAVVCAHLDIDTPIIYGFGLRNKRISTEETLLSVSLSKYSVSNFIKHLPILRKFERQMGIKITRCYSTQHKEEHKTKLVLVGDKKWVSSPLLISIYTLLIRSFTYATPTSDYDSHIKALISENFGNDVDTFKTLRERNIDLLHLLLNIEKILGDHPLTGIDDLALKEGKLKIINDQSTVYLDYIAENESHAAIGWSIYKNHGGHGILKLTENMHYRRTGESYAKRCIGTHWTNNYHQLCKAEEVDNQS